MGGADVRGFSPQISMWRRCPWLYARAQITPNIIDTQNPGHQAARGGDDVRGYRDTVFQTGYNDTL